MTDNIKASDEVESDVNELLQKKDFGSALRQAREKAGMSLVEVSENLLISIDVISALESSQADALPALTFTQGYIRSYARLLNVSADEIISDYVKMAPQSKQVLTPHTILPVQKSSGDFFVKFITFGFIVIGLIVLVFWISNTDFKISSDVKTEIVAFDQRTTAGNTPVETEAPFLKEVDSAEKVDVVEKAVKPVAVEAEDKESVNIKAEVKLQQDQLFLSALGESWCEIQDSTGKRLYYRLLNKGDEVTLEGVAPFTVFLGNAPRIRVEINNKIVDFENLINKNSNIANLEISKNAAVIRIPNH